MASAAPRPRLQSSTRFLARLQRVGFLNSISIVDPEFDDDANSEPLTAETLDHLHNQHGVYRHAS